MKRFVCHINNFLKINMRFCKPLAVKPLTVAWVLILVTLAGCGVAEFEETSEEEVEYTNIEYLENGKEVRLYLDGIGIPSTRAQRAITKDLAQTAFDFIEVIFVNGDLASGTSISRASWILGQPAKIDNIERNGTTGVNYGNVFPAVTNGPAACMFVGRDDGKVLLGVGQLTASRNENGSSGTALITANTRSVTFTIAALQTGLIITGESVGTNPVNATVDSLTYDAGNTSPYNAKTTTTYRKTMGNVQYPVFCLPNTDNTTVGMLYAFVFGSTSVSGTYRTAVRYINNGTTVIPLIQKRTPRYLDGIKYKEPRSAIDTTTTMSISGCANNDPFDVSIALSFTSHGTNKGIFSFNVQIPVYMVSRTAATKNSGPAAVTWYVRTGVGSEFYSLDEGFSRGGCVLMSTGISSAEFNNIEWTWFKGF